jgi:cystathionine beta-lyase/cystathionine gamma-synthase
MNESEFGFETQAIRNQLERSQFQEHSVPLYLTSSFVFEDAEDMRASFSADLAIQTQPNLLKKFAKWKVPKRVMPLQQEWQLYILLLLPC